MGQNHMGFAIGRAGAMDGLESTFLCPHLFGSQAAI
jgi:hypothetical protein